MSTIYWKFKNTKSEFSSITFDSTHVSILDLKRAIIKQKQLQQTPQRPFDLSIINAHTGVEYTDETGPIPRNLAVIVRRLPAARNQHKKLWAPLQNNAVIATADNISKKQIQTISERLNHEFGPALFNDSGVNSNSNLHSNLHSNSLSSNGNSAEVNAVETETISIIDMMNRRMNNGASTTTSINGIHRNNRMSNRHHNNNNNMKDSKDQKQSYRSQRGDPPPGYICHRCHISGHWIQDCPTNGDPKFDKKNRSQTLRSQLPVPKPATPTNVSGDNTQTNIPTQQVIVGQKCYQIPTNVYDSFNGDHSKIKAYIEISSGVNNFTQQSAAQGTAAHSRYKCEICDNYYVDARFTPCCRVTYCNECIRQKSLVQNPSMIKCPSCEEIFSSDALDAAQNTKLQEKVDKIVAQRAKQAANSNNIISSSSITVTATKTENNNTTNTKPIIASPPKTIQIPTPHTMRISQPPLIPKIRPTVILQRISPPSVIAIDTTRFEAPNNTVPIGTNINYVCIECNERGHKYKDCPKVAEKQKNAINKTDHADTTDENINNIDDGLDRIPKKSPNDNEKIINNKGIGFINAINHINPPQVQLINNSTLNTINAINSVNMMNMRNRMTVNNILMNAALHNASRRGGIAPRLINSHNNPLLIRPQYQLLQQQSLLTQAAALNRLRSMNNNYSNTIQMSKTNDISNIPQHILDSTINELKQVMTSSQDPSAVTNAINAAFIKLGAIDPDSKRLLLEQLVKTCANNSNNENNLKTNDIETQNELNNLDNRKSKKKHKKSKSKRSKKKKRDKDQHKRHKDRKHRHSKRKKERDRKSTDFPDPDDNDDDDDDCSNVIHVNIESINHKKRKLPPDPMSPIPDFASSPTHSPKLKKQKLSI